MQYRQKSFAQSSAFKDATRVSHGGTLRQGRRKLKRPFDAKKPLHLILRSSRAKGEWSFLREKNGRRIKHLVHSLALRTGVKVHRFANSGNHLHLLIHAKSREEFQSYLRALSGMVSRIVTGAKKGNRVGKFWDALAYSRVVQWGKDFVNVKYYLIRNELEGLGILFHSERPSKKPAPE